MIVLFVDMLWEVSISGICSVDVFAVVFVLFVFR